MIPIAGKMGKAWNVAEKPKQKMMIRGQLVLSEQNWPRKMEVWRPM